MDDSVTRWDELDAAVVAALQINPRASWTQVGRVLAVAPSTASRRWERLADAGLAWTTVAPGRRFVRWGVYGVLSVRAHPKAINSVARALLHDPQVVTLEILTGAADLELTVAMPDWSSFTRYNLDRVARVDGVSSVESTFATSVIKEGSHWQSGGISRSSADLLRQRSQRPPRDQLDSVDRLLLRQLSVDARQPFEHLAETIGVSAPTLRRRLEAILVGQVFTLRCDVAAPFWGWPIQVRLRGDSGGAEAFQQIDLSDIRQLRFMMSATGSHDFHATAWLRSLADLPTLENRLTHSLPRLKVAERSVTAKALKRVGCLLDDNGRRIRAASLAALKEPSA